MAEERRKAGVGYKDPEEQPRKGSKDDIIAKTKPSSFFPEAAKVNEERPARSVRVRKYKKDGDDITILNLPPLRERKIANRTRASNDESAVIAQAVEVIGDKSAALRWMGTPVRALDYATPVSLLGTREGRLAVITVLGRLEHGVL